MTSVLASLQLLVKCLVASRDPQQHCLVTARSRALTYVWHWSMTVNGCKWEDVESMSCTMRVAKFGHSFRCVSSTVHTCTAKMDHFRMNQRAPSLHRVAFCEDPPVSRFEAQVRLLIMFEK